MLGHILLGHYNSAKAHLDSGKGGLNLADSQGFTPLLLCCVTQQRTIAKLLCDHGAEVNYRNVTMDLPDPTCLDLIITLNDLTMFDLLINYKLDVQAVGMDGWTMLMKAASLNRTDLVRRLLEAGAKANSRNKYGSTALMMAAEHGHLESLQCLIAHRAKVNLANQNGTTALFRAIRNNHQLCVTALIKAGADLTYQDPQGWTAARLAARRPAIQLA